MNTELERLLRLRILYLKQMELHAKDEDPIEFMYWSIKHIEAFQKILDLTKGAKGNEERIFEGLNKCIRRNKRSRKKR